MLLTGPFSIRCRTWSSALMLSLLAACGGGGDSAAPAAAAPAAPTATISGTAATGAPLAGAAVVVKCQGGVNANTTTLANGNFSVSVTAGALPCAISVTPAGGGTTLFSIASTTGTPTAPVAVTANVTPLTSLSLALAVNAASAQAIADWFANPATVQAVVNALTGAQTSLQTALTAAGYTLPSPFSPFTAGFTPAAGNAYDDLLEAFAAALRSAGVTYAAAQTSFAGSGGSSGVPSASSGGGANPGGTVPATVNAALVKSYELAFYVGGGTGCGSACSFTDGMAVPVTVGAGNTLSIAGKTLSNPYNRILGGSPHTPEIIWRDGDIEYAMTDNDSGAFSEINVGDLATPVNGFPRFLGQIRAVQQTGPVLVTQFAGDYTKAFQYHGLAAAAAWTGVTIAADGALTFTGGAGPSLTAAQMAKITDYAGCCGSVLIDASIDINHDSVVDSYDSIRLFRNAAGKLSGIEYYTNGSDFAGVSFGPLDALPDHTGAAIPATNQIAGTANGTAYAIAVEAGTGGAYSFPNQGGFSLTANTGTGNQQQIWSIQANREGPLAAGAVFTCREAAGGNKESTMTFTASSNIYRSTAGGRCEITVTSVTFTGSVVTAFEGRFVAELRTFKRDLAPLIVNDGVFHWVKQP